MRLARFLHGAARDERGVAAVEMALVSGLLAMALLNVVEVGRYAYMTAQVGAASQAGAHAALVRCNPTETPVTTNCAALNGAVTAAIRGGSLGAAVTLRGALTEAWYCVNASGGLQRMSDADERPIDCEDAGVPNGTPSLYLRVTTQYVYTPLFPGLTITETFSPTIVRASWMRMR